MSGSYQNEIPVSRINLRLDVGSGDGKKRIELPLKLLVLADFSSKEKNEKISEREKIGVDKNNLERVMESMDLKLRFKVKNVIDNSGDLDVEHKIQNMDSFSPEKVAVSIPALNRLIAARNVLKDLKMILSGNKELRNRLEDIIKDPRSVKELQAELSNIVQIDDQID